MLGDPRNVAAVSIMVYNRIVHFQACIESLLKNPLAKLTDLYIFSDGPKSGDEEAVQKVRDFAGSISGFSSVLLHFQETNDFSRNAKDVLSVPLENHERVIYMEDDNVVSSTFLAFMNEALEIYRDDPRIASVSGWAAPVTQSKIYKDDVYLSQNWSFWTAGVWRDKRVFDFLKFERPYSDMIENRLERRVNRVNPGLPHGLRKIELGIQHAPDRQLTYYLMKYGRYQLRPVKSLVMNTGHDGTGMNSVRSDRFGYPPFEGDITLPKGGLSYSAAMDRRQYRFLSWRKSRRHQMAKLLRRLRRTAGLAFIRR